MKKSLLIGVLAAAVLATSLSGCGSESTSALEDYLQDIADVSDDDDEAEDVKDEDSEQEAEASEDDTADGDAVVVSDEAYIERLEAYQEYYNSVKDEDENYEVLAAISLDEDNLPIMWLMFADKDKLRKLDRNFYPFKDVEGYVEVCEYKNKDVTVIAKTSRFSSDDGIVILPLNTVLSLSNDLNINGEVTWYDDGTCEFVEPVEVSLCYDSSPDVFAWFYSAMGISCRVVYDWDGETTDKYIYYGSYTGVCDIDLHEDWWNRRLSQDMLEFNAYWWDGTPVATDKEFAVFCAEIYVTFISFEDNNDFNILIEDLIEKPVYDIGMIALKSTRGRFYDIEYVDLDNIDTLFEELVNQYCEYYDCSYDEAVELINQLYGLNLE